jgi:hypothetical protein
MDWMRSRPADEMDWVIIRSGMGPVHIVETSPAVEDAQDSRFVKT